MKAKTILTIKTHAIVIFVVVLTKVAAAAHMMNANAGGMEM